MLSFGFGFGCVLVSWDLGCGAALKVVQHIRFSHRFLRASLYHPSALPRHAVLMEGQFAKAYAFAHATLPRPWVLKFWVWVVLSCVCLRFLCLSFGCLSFGFLSFGCLSFEVYVSECCALSFVFV